MLEERLGGRAKMLSALNAIAATVSQSTEVGEIQRLLLKKALQVVGADAGLLSLVVERGRSPEVSCLGVPKSSVRDFHRIALVKFSSTPEALPPKGSARTDEAQAELLVVDDVDGSHAEGAAALSAQGFKSVACVPLRSNDRLLGVLALFYRTSCRYVDEDRELLLSIAHQVAVALDNSRLYGRLTERIKETEVLYQVGRTIISTLDRDEVLRQILKVVQESFGYSRCGILLIDDERGELYVKAAHGHAPAVTTDCLRLKLGREGITGHVAATGQPLNVPDVSRDPRYVPGPTPAASELALPLKIGKQIIGVLDVQSNRIAAFGERDMRILSSFADQAAIAIENARLYDRTRQMGVIEERNRLAREIHDVLAQDLTGTIVQLEAADNLLSKGNHRKAQEVLRKAMEQARESLREARRSIAGLRAAPLEYLPLSEAIASEIKAFVDESGINVSCNVSGDDGDLSPEIATALYRVLKEGLSNVRQHAAARNVEVSLVVNGQACALTIQDDGVGFDPSEIDRLGALHQLPHVPDRAKPEDRETLANDAFQSGQDVGLRKRFGLIGMRERARLLGGEMTLESSVGAGTRIEVDVPVKFGRGTEGGRR